MAFTTQNFEGHEYDISVHTFDFLKESLVFVYDHDRHHGYGSRVFSAAFWDFDGKCRVLRIRRAVDYFADKIMLADRGIEDVDFDLASLQEYVHERTGTTPYYRGKNYHTNEIPTPERLNLESEILNCLKPLRRRLVFGDEEQIDAIRQLSSRNVRKYLKNYRNYSVEPLKSWEL